MRAKIEKIAILVFFAAITVVCVYVLLFQYKPNQNALGALASVCMDIESMIIVLVLVVNLILEKKQIDRTTKFFMALMVGTKWALFLDFLTWSSDGALAYNSMSFLYTVGSLCMGAILGAIFVLYLGSYLVDMYGLKSVIIRAKICSICNLVAFAITFVLAITHTGFVFVDGHYEVGMLYDLVTAIPVLTLVYMTAYSIKHVKKIGIHDIIAIGGYILIMIGGALIEGEFGIGTTYVAITIADIFIFVMLQNKIIDKEKQNAEKWMKKSNMDELTSFYNRYAYEEAISSYEENNLPADFVYVSIDINGLKVVNDTLGHAAGDELILGACECMRKSFGPYGKLFRTGGDEFVALLNANDSKLEKIKNDVERTTENWEGKLNSGVTLSCGYVTKEETEGLSLHQIAVIADKKMYAEKTKYYQKKGVDRRGQRNAHVALCALYTKILKINLTNDAYQIINMDLSEQTADGGITESLTEWLTGFAKSGNVHPEDTDSFLSATDISNISKHFKESKESLRIHYRRKFKDTYKPVMMEIIPANDYSDEIQTMFLYVKEL